MRAEVSELIGTGNIAHCVNVGIVGFQKFVYFDGAAFRYINTELLKTVALQSCFATHCDKKHVKFNSYFLALAVANQGLGARLDIKFSRFVFKPHVNAFFQELVQYHLRVFRVFSWHEPGSLLNLRDPGPQSGKRL